MTGLDRKKDDEIIEVLRMMAPGTSLREGLDNICWPGRVPLL